MYVWRLEKEDGTGVFASGAVFCMPEEIKTKEANPYRHPCPDQDGINWYATNGSFYCGFRSLKQMKTWFPLAKQRKFLETNGIVLRKFKANKKEILFGRTQIMFRRLETSHIEERSPAYGRKTKKTEILG